MSFNLEALPEQIRDQVKVVDKGSRFEATHGFIEDVEKYRQIKEALLEVGFEPLGYYGSLMHYEIQKENLGTQSQPINKDVGNESPKDEASKPQLPERADTKKLEPPEGEPEEYSLKESLDIGKLYPVLKDAHGNVIDGFHRLQVDSDWPVKKLDHITNPLELAKARLVTNVCRRDVPAKEKTEWLRQIASMTGWSAKEIAENLPVSYTWVMKYLPDEFKDKEKVIAGAKGGEALRQKYEEVATRRRAKSEDIRHDKWMRCEGEGCNIKTKYNPERVVDGKLLCSKCYQKITGEPTPPTARTPEPPQPPTKAPPPIPIANFEVCLNEEPNTIETYPYEVVEITEDGSQTLALFTDEDDASIFVRCKEEAGSD